MHVAGGHDADVGEGRQPGQHVIALVVTRVVVAVQLYHHVLVPEQLSQLRQLRPGRVGAPGGERGRHRPLAASGQHHPVPVVRPGQRFGVIDRSPLFPARQLGGADHGAQPGVTFRVAGQDQQVLAFRVGYTGLAG